MNAKTQQIFSVVLLSYNQNLYWFDAIDSILHQDYPAIQFIMCDDGSNNFNEQLIENYIEKNKRNNLIDYSIISNSQNLGTAANCDVSLDYINGEFVLFLDGDDALAENNVLSRIYDCFCNLPASEKVVTGNVMVCDNNLKNGSRLYSSDFFIQKNNQDVEQQFKEIFLDFWPVPSATAFRNDIFEHAGKFKVEENRLCQDGYFYINLMQRGYKFNCIDYVIAKHRAGGVCDSTMELSPSAIEVKKEFLKIAEKLIFTSKDSFTTTEFEKIILRYYENFISYLQTGNDYRISEPTYSIVSNWASQNNIWWDYDKSDIVYPSLNRHWHGNGSVSRNISTKKTDCCGCGACADICPQKAIIMEEDEQGFLYPFILDNLCISCRKCDDVCPLLKKDSPDFIEPTKYIWAKSKNETIRQQSRSGGFFAELANYIIEFYDGIVYGSVFDENHNIIHKRITRSDEIHLMQGSKYTQSVIGQNYSLVERDLKNGKKVLFSGTPCQVHGLLLFLAKRNVETNNLFTIDIVCHGVSSPAIYREYLQEIQNKYNGKILNVNFRDKYMGWRNYVESFVIDTHKTCHKYYFNYFSHLFFSNNILRPSCYDCHYCTYNRCSDITIADAWGIEKQFAIFDDDKGLNMIMLRTSKAFNLWEHLKGCFLYKDSQKHYSLQPNLIAPSSKGDNYSRFWREYNTNGIRGIMGNIEEINSKRIHNIGIITFHRAHNFGAMLQAWALKQILVHRGYNVNIIDYRCQSIEHSYERIPWQIIKPLNIRIKESGFFSGLRLYKNDVLSHKKLLEIWNERRTNFNIFLSKQLGVRGIGFKSFDKSSSHYDAVICGSDQIWATNDPIYYGSIYNVKKLIAYAASSGKSTIDDSFKNEAKNLLSRFSAISVRESGLKEYIEKEFNGGGIQITLDPTLLLNKEDYIPLMPKNKRVDYEYVYCYAVLENSEMISFAKKIADKYNIKLVVERAWILQEEDYIQVANSGPSEFLNWINNSSFVVTNSFHGTVFSLLFHKSFFSFYENGKNVRIDDLLESLDLKQRHSESINKEITEINNWDDIDMRIGDLRADSIKFIQYSLYN